MSLLDSVILQFHFWKSPKSDYQNVFFLICLFSIVHFFFFNFFLYYTRNKKEFLNKPATQKIGPSVAQTWNWQEPICYCEIYSGGQDCGNMRATNMTAVATLPAVLHSRDIFKSKYPETLGGQQCSAHTDMSESWLWEDLRAETS